MTADDLIKRRLTKSSSDGPTHVHLFGNYNSRGGTVAIRAGSAKEAHEKYVNDFTDDPDPKVRAGLHHAAKQDYLGTAEIHGLPKDHPGGDLEQEGVVLKKGRGTPHDFVSGNAKTHHVLKFVPESSFKADHDADCRFCGDSDMHNHSEHKGWHHPRWEDDAFGFSLMEK
jgi:hypothetical protein